MSQLSLNDHDAVLAWKRPPEFIGDHLAPNSTAQDENRLRHTLVAS